jgi:methyl-branched lipid omega-hydroxylase
VTHPVEELAADDIQLADPELWKRPEEVIEGALRTLRRERPVSFHREYGHGDLIKEGPGFWALTRYDDIERVSRDHRTFVTGGGISIWDFPPEMAQSFHHMGNEDGDRHTRLRRIVSRAFTPKVLGHLREVIAEEARSVVDAIVDRGEVEFVSEVGGRLPVRIICEMIGIPAEHHEFVYRKSDVAIRVADPAYLLGSGDVEQTFGEIAAAGFELAVLLQQLSQERMRTPGDDILSTLMSSAADGEALTETELIQFFILLTVAGNETTRNALAWGMHALSAFPEQRARWAADVDGHAATATDEVIRWATPVIYFRRTAARDTEVGGQAIAAGDKVVMFYRSGNRDESVFPDPYAFDITRRNRPPHMAFGGGGPHHCLGAHLARMEVSAMFSELLRRVPDIAVTGTPVRPGGNLAHGLDELRCSFTPGGVAAGGAPTPVR